MDKPQQVLHVVALDLREGRHVEPVPAKQPGRPGVTPVNLCPGVVDIGNQPFLLDLRGNPAEVGADLGGRKVVAAGAVPVEEFQAVLDGKLVSCVAVWGCRGTCVFRGIFRQAGGAQ